MFRQFFENHSLKLIAFIPFGIILGLLAFFEISPAEDAYITFRYAKHFAEGYGIVWNVGGNPVEGGTSFLWIIILGIAHFIGWDIPITAQVLSLVAIVSSILIFYSQTKVDHVLAILFASLFAFSPIIIQGLSGFEAPLFSLFILLWLVSYEKKAFKVTALLSLLMGLIRPEGAILAILLWGVAWKDFKAWRNDVLIFIVLGATYFLWRWWYFGYMLPNTFYVKSAGSLLHFPPIETYLPFYLIAFGIWYYSRNRFGVVLLLFPLLYLFIEQSQNIGWRFQYPVLAGLIYLSLSSNVRTRKFDRIVFTFFTLASMFWLYSTYLSLSIVYDERKELGERLQKYNISGERPWCVVTEAGWFPYYSEWNVVDAVGLNDEHIAHNGLTEKYLDSIAPRMIMFHVYSDTLKEDWANGDKKWNDITKFLYNYAETRGFYLVAITNVPYDCRWWYFKDIPIELLMDVCYANTNYVKRAVLIK